MVFCHFELHSNIVVTNYSIALPFLHHTELLLTPVAVFTILWFISLFGANLPKHLAPVLWAGAKLRKSV